MATPRRSTPHPAAVSVQVLREEMATHEVGHDGLVLSSVSLHIDNVVPHNSIASIEAQKAAAETISSSKVKLTDEAAPQRPSLSAQDSWAQLQIKDRMQWMEHFKQNKRGGLVFQDRETLKKQQGVFKEVMMQVGSQLLSGKLAVRISLPIRIFEPRSLLERVANGWNYAPTVLKKAALSGGDPIERMKFVMAFVAGGLHFCVGQLKPFNPILGETYEATYADGTQVFMEHVSHHPVKTAFSVVGPKGLYQMSGIYEFESTSTRNSLANYQNGAVTITFHDGAIITYTMPQIKMSGILFGERVVEIVGTSRFEDMKNRLVGELHFDANNSFLKKSQSDDIKGCIYPAKVRSSLLVYYKHPMCSDVQPRLLQKSAKHAVASVHGSWLSHLQFDGKTVLLSELLDARDGKVSNEGDHDQRSQLRDHTGAGCRGRACLLRGSLDLRRVELLAAFKQELADPRAKPPLLGSDAADKGFHAPKVRIRENGDEERGLQVHLDECLADERGAEKRPEGHEEVPAADAAEVEGHVGPGRHEQHAPEAVLLEEADHPVLHAVHEVVLGLGLGDLLELFVALPGELGGAAERVGRDLSRGGAGAPEHAGQEDLPEDGGERDGGLLGHVVAVGLEWVEPHVVAAVEVQRLALLRALHHEEDVREEEEDARVHARAQAHAREHAEADPPGHELGAGVELVQQQAVRAVAARGHEPQQRQPADKLPPIPAAPAVAKHRKVLKQQSEDKDKKMLEEARRLEEEKKKRERGIERVKQAQERARARVARTNQLEQQSLNEARRHESDALSATDECSDKVRRAQESRRRAKERVRMRRRENPPYATPPSSAPGLEREATQLNSFRRKTIKRLQVYGRLRRVGMFRLLTSGYCARSNQRAHRTEKDERQSTPDRSGQIDPDQIFKERKLRQETAARLRHQEEFEAGLQNHKSKLKDMDRVAKGFKKQSSLPQLREDAREETFPHSPETQYPSPARDASVCPPNQDADSSSESDASNNAHHPDQTKVESVQSMEISSRRTKLPAWRQPPVPLQPVQVYAYKAILPVYICICL
ncbi:unnamed protein product [Phytophthora fragariaefolia]|uniref:Unnamed protein product n=1 Tax=Phytophthora fragariaefolia TaxID=1490495 RepID=A0A9W7CN93_9STRA|nr:unnamed protein product [Phytophthora fragariaefolia]